LCEQCDVPETQDDIGPKRACINHAREREITMIVELIGTALALLFMSALVGPERRG
jgi:hypothetical protein